MGTRESYEAGTFSWADLATTDADAAKAFYAKVFGWDFDDMPMPGGNGTYSMAQVDGKRVGAVFEADGPARWNSYVSVDDIEAIVEKVEENDGTVHQTPLDVGDETVWAAQLAPATGLDHLEPSTLLVLDEPGDIAEAFGASGKPAESSGAR